MGGNPRYGVEPEGRFESELAEARLELEQKNQLQRALDREIVELRTLLKESDRQLATVRATLSYRLGATLVDARRPAGLAKLPRKLFDLWRGQRIKRKGDGPRLRPSDRLRYVDSLLQRLEQDGAHEAAAYAATLPDRQAKEKARALVELAIACRNAEPELTLSLAASAAALNPCEARLRALAFECYEQGDVLTAAGILDAATPDILSTAAQLRRANTIHSDARQLRQPRRLPELAQAERNENSCIAVISDRALPSHADASTYRARHILDLAASEGLRGILISEPGYRYPAKGDGRAIHQDSDQGAGRLLLPPLSCAPGDADAYVEEAAGLLERQFRALNVSIVYLVAEPLLAFAAACAARRCGLPYFCDVGSISAAGKAGQDGWSGTERFNAVWSRHRTVLAGAEAIVARSSALADRIGQLMSEDLLSLPPIRRFCDVLPENWVRASEASQRDIRRELGVAEGQRLFGIISGGECEDETSLKQALAAFPAVVARYPEAVLVYCGPSRVGQMVRREAAKNGCGNSVIVPDGFVRQRLAQYISSFSAMLFTKPIEEAAGLRSPFELQAALRLGTPVVAVDGAPAREWIENGATGLLVAGDSSAIAEGMISCLEDPAEAQKRSAAAAACIARSCCDGASAGEWLSLIRQP